MNALASLLTASVLSTVVAHNANAHRICGVILRGATDAVASEIGPVRLTPYHLPFLTDEQQVYNGTLVDFTAQAEHSDAIFVFFPNKYASCGVVSTDGAVWAPIEGIQPDMHVTPKVHSHTDAPQHCIPFQDICSTTWPILHMVEANVQGQLVASNGAVLPAEALAATAMTAQRIDEQALDSAHVYNATIDVVHNTFSFMEPLPEGRYAVRVRIAGYSATVGMTVRLSAMHPPIVISLPSPLLFGSRPDAGQRVRVTGEGKTEEGVVHAVEDIGERTVASAPLSGFFALPLACDCSASETAAHCGKYRLRGEEGGAYGGALWQSADAVDPCSKAQTVATLRVYQLHVQGRVLAAPHGRGVANVTVVVNHEQLVTTDGEGWYSLHLDGSSAALHLSFVMEGASFYDIDKVVSIGDLRVPDVYPRSYTICGHVGLGERLLGVLPLKWRMMRLFRLPDPFVPPPAKPAAASSHGKPAYPMSRSEHVRIIHATDDLAVHGVRFSADVASFMNQGGNLSPSKPVVSTIQHVSHTYKTGAQLWHRLTNVVNAGLELLTSTGVYAWYVQPTARWFVSLLRHMPITLLQLPCFGFQCPHRYHAETDKNAVSGLLEYDDTGQWGTFFGYAFSNTDGSYCLPEMAAGKYLVLPGVTAAELGYLGIVSHPLGYYVDVGAPSASPVMDMHFTLDWPTLYGTIHVPDGHEDDIEVTLMPVLDQSVSRFLEHAPYTIPPPTPVSLQISSKQSHTVHGRSTHHEALREVHQLLAQSGRGRSSQRFLYPHINETGGFMDADDNPRHQIYEDIGSAYGSYEGVRATLSGVLTYAPVRGLISHRKGFTFHGLWPVSYIVKVSEPASSAQNLRCWKHQPSGHVRLSAGKDARLDIYPSGRALTINGDSKIPLMARSVEGAWHARLGEPFDCVTGVDVVLRVPECIRGDYITASGRLHGTASYNAVTDHLSIEGKPAQWPVDFLATATAVRGRVMIPLRGQGAQVTIVVNSTTLLNTSMDENAGIPFELVLPVGSTTNVRFALRTRSDDGLETEWQMDYTAYVELVGGVDQSFASWCSSNVRLTLGLALTSGTHLRDYPRTEGHHVYGTVWPDVVFPYYGTISGKILPPTAGVQVYFNPSMVFPWNKLLAPVSVLTDEDGAFTAGTLLMLPHHPMASSPPPTHVQSSGYDIYIAASDPAWAPCSSSDLQICFQQSVPLSFSMNTGDATSCKIAPALQVNITLLNDNGRHSQYSMSTIARCENGLYAVHGVPVAGKYLVIVDDAKVAIETHPSSNLPENAFILDLSRSHSVDVSLHFTTCRASGQLASGTAAGAVICARAGNGLTYQAAVDDSNHFTIASSDDLRDLQSAWLQMAGSCSNGASHLVEVHAVESADCVYSLGTLQLGDQAVGEADLPAASKLDVDVAGIVPSVQATSNALSITLLVLGATTLYWLWMNSADTATKRDVSYVSSREGRKPMRAR